MLQSYSILRVKLAHILQCLIFTKAKAVVSSSQDPLSCKNNRGSNIYNNQQFIKFNLIVPGKWSILASLLKVQFTNQPLKSCSNFLKYSLSTTVFKIEYVIHCHKFNSGMFIWLEEIVVGNCEVIAVVNSEFSLLNVDVVGAFRACRKFRLQKNSGSQPP